MALFELEPLHNGRSWHVIVDNEDIEITDWYAGVIRRMASLVRYTMLEADVPAAEAYRRLLASRELEPRDARTVRDYVELVDSVDAVAEIMAAEVA